MTATEWAAYCEPWADLVAAHEFDVTLRLVCADWFQENAGRTEWARDPLPGFRDAARTPRDGTTELMLGRLGGRGRCPLCRSPLERLECLMCEGRRHVPRYHFELPTVVSPALTLGLCGLPGGPLDDTWRIGCIGSPRLPSTPAGGLQSGPGQSFALRPAECDRRRPGSVVLGYIDSTLLHQLPPEADGLLVRGVYVADERGRVAGRSALPGGVFLSNGDTSSLQFVFYPPAASAPPPSGAGVG